MKKNQVIDFGNAMRKKENLKLCVSAWTNFWGANDELIGTGATIQYSTGPTMLEGENVRRVFMCASPWQDTDHILFEIKTENDTSLDAILVRSIDCQDPTWAMEVLLGHPKMMVDLFDRHKRRIDREKQFFAHEILAHIYEEEVEGEYHAYYDEET
ncbi:MAG: hypothetical protein IK016_11035 [Lachnospiraceae bacterium]|nr:hypothetical protein [Lachnospiraceae bacterium]